MPKIKTELVSGMNHLFYILDPITHETRTTNDVLEWGASFETASRIVQQTRFDEVLVSTVFLGLDHRYGLGPPLLFETMIFGGPLNGEQWRHSTWDDAVAFHREAIKAARRAHTPWRRIKAYVIMSKAWRAVSHKWYSFKWKRSMRALRKE